MGSGYRYYVIHGILRMTDTSLVTRTYESGYYKYHNGFLASSLDLKFTPKIGMSLSYDHYLGRCQADNYYVAFVWKVGEENFLDEGRVFLKFVRSHGHYGALFLGISGQAVLYND